MTETLATIRASGPRRVVAVGIVGVLGALLLSLAVLRPPDSLTGQAVLLLLGALAVLIAARQWQATATALVLTDQALGDEHGRIIVRTADIVSVDRGIFAFKPANGFILRLKRSEGAAWAPGLWWRVGRRVGVGGAISKAEGRHMADRISALIAGRR